MILRIRFGHGIAIVGKMSSKIRSTALSAAPASEYYGTVAAISVLPHEIGVAWWVDCTAGGALDGRSLPKVCFTLRHSHSLLHRIPPALWCLSVKSMPVQDQINIGIHAELPDLDEGTTPYFSYY